MSLVFIKTIILGLLLYIKTYNFESDNIVNSNGQSMTGIWIHYKCLYSRNKQIEDHENPVIAVKIGFPNKGKINLISYYCQWHLLGNVRDDKCELEKFRTVSKK